VDWVAPEKGVRFAKGGRVNPLGPQVTITQAAGSVRQARTPGGEKGPAARRRPRTGREAYSLYVERPVEGGNEAEGPLSASG